MNAKEVSRLSIGITFRFDIKKALMSQAGVFLALVYMVISEGHPPFGDKPYELLSPTTALILINLFVFAFMLITIGSSSIRLFPSMLTYIKRGNQTRIEFGRVTRAVLEGDKNLKFYILDSFSKEKLGLKIGNIKVYGKSDKLLEYLKYFLGPKFKRGSVKKNVRRKPQIFNFGAGN